MKVLKTCLLSLPLLLSYSAHSVEVVHSYESNEAASIRQQDARSNPFGRERGAVQDQVQSKFTKGLVVRNGVLPKTDSEEEQDASDGEDNEAQDKVVTQALDGNLNIDLEQMQDAKENDVNAIFSATVDLNNNIDDALLIALRQALDLTLAYEDYKKNEVVNIVAKYLKDIVILDNKLTLNIAQPQVAPLKKDLQPYIIPALDSPIMGFVVIHYKRKNIVANTPKRSKFLQMLDQEAKDLNYEIIYPVMDLDDEAVFNDKSILGHNHRALSKAAMRYESKYFVSASLRHEGADFVFMRYNLYDLEGNLLASDELQGPNEYIAKSLALDLAKAALGRNDFSSRAHNIKRGNNVDLDLGFKDGIIRISMDGIRTLKDIRQLKDILISYGYEENLRIVAYHDGNLIMELYASGSPAILDGNFKNSKNFKRFAPWKYELIEPQQDE